MVVAYINREATLAALAISKGISHAIICVNIAPPENVALRVVIEIETFLSI